MVGRTTSSGVAALVGWHWIVCFGLGGKHMAAGAILASIATANVFADALAASDASSVFAP